MYQNSISFISFEMCNLQQFINRILLVSSPVSLAHYHHLLK